MKIRIEWKSPNQSVLEGKSWLAGYKSDFKKKIDWIASIPGEAD